MPINESHNFAANEKCPHKNHYSHLMKFRVLFILDFPTNWNLLFFCQTVSIFLLKIIKDKMSMNANKITLYFIGVIKQVLKIICDNVTINMFLYL